MTEGSNTDAALLNDPGRYGIAASSRRRFLLDDGNTSFVALVASAVCSNIGIGSFVAIFLFSSQSVLVGTSVVAAYTLGLILCGLLAPKIHDLGRHYGWYGLVDLIVGSHNVSRALFIWLPVAFVFILRAAVQFSALALLLSQLLTISFLASLIVTSLIIGSYIAFGGYRAATQTDIYYGAIILALSALLAAGLFLSGGSSGDTQLTALEQKNWLDLGSYEPFFLIGIWLFLPFSPLLAIDNWQRIATARTAKTARYGYWITAVICGLIYALIVVVGLIASVTENNGEATHSVFESFRALMPSQAPWLADILFITAIVSSIDTFVMPLVTGLGRYCSKLYQLRFAALLLTLCAASLAYLFGSVLDTVIAAFNSLVIFLPPIIDASILRQPKPAAALSSILIGTFGATAFTLIDPQVAGLAGFVFSSVVYALAHWQAGQSASGNQI